MTTTLSALLSLSQTELIYLFTIVKAMSAKKDQFIEALYMGLWA